MIPTKKKMHEKLSANTQINKEKEKNKIKKCKKKKEREN